MYTNGGSIKGRPETRLDQPGSAARFQYIAVMDIADGHGVPLVERVLGAIRAEPQRLIVNGDPLLTSRARPLPPEALATDDVGRLRLDRASLGPRPAATFPSGRPLPPSLRRWLEFDTDLLARCGWLDAGDPGRFTPRRLDEIATAEWGPDWGGLYAPLAGPFDECFLLPGGTDSRRILATGSTDSFGEAPVFALDIDDLPYVGLMYPGFDVYLADTFGLLPAPTEDGYGFLMDDPVYGDRMREHARHWFGGEGCAEYPFRGAG
jgi:hypothetical protein